MPSAQRIVCCSLVVSMLLGCIVTSFSQQISKADRDLAQQMLRDVAVDITKYYYDLKLHGVDWNAKVRQARENIDKADSMDSAVSEIAALLDSLNDSHTALLLPPRNLRIQVWLQPEDDWRPLLRHSRSYRQRRGEERS